MFKKVFITIAIIAAFAGCAVVNWTGLSAIKFDNTQHPEITFGYGESITNEVDGELDFGAANLSTTGNATFPLMNYAGASDNKVGTDSFQITMTNPPASYVRGQFFIFKADTPNTGACAINVNSLGWKALKSLHNADPANDYIEKGSMVMICFDDTTFQILSPDANP